MDDRETRYNLANASQGNRMRPTEVTNEFDYYTFGINELGMQYQEMLLLADFLNKGLYRFGYRAGIAVPEMLSSEYLVQTTASEISSKISIGAFDTDTSPTAGNPFLIAISSGIDRFEVDNITSESFARAAVVIRTTGDKWEVISQQSGLPDEFMGEIENRLKEYGALRWLIRYVTATSQEAPTVLSEDELASLFLSMVNVPPPAQLAKKILEGVSLTLPVAKEQFNEALFERGMAMDRANIVCAILSVSGILKKYGLSAHVLADDSNYVKDGKKIPLPGATPHYFHKGGSGVVDILLLAEGADRVNPTGQINCAYGHCKLMVGGSMHTEIKEVLDMFNISYIQ